MVEHESEEAVPVWDREQPQLLVQVPVQHVFVVGDSQYPGHGVCVKRRVQCHQCAVYPFSLEIICILLENGETHTHTRTNAQTQTHR